MHVIAEDPREDHVGSLLLPKVLEAICVDNGPLVASQYGLTSAQRRGTYRCNSRAPLHSGLGFTCVPVIVTKDQVLLRLIKSRLPYLEGACQSRQGLGREEACIGVYMNVKFNGGGLVLCGGRPRTEEATQK